MINEIINADCIKFMKQYKNGGGTVNITLTDIPFGVVNKKSNGLRVIDKGDADNINFELDEFLNLVYDITTGTVIIFCAKEQLSQIYKFFAAKQGTTRQLIWQKSNPSPMNGEYVYLSGIENAVWYKKRGGVFNARCKNTVFKFPNGRSKLHPTEKNHDLIRELILDNSNVGDIVFDPCCGSGTHCLVAAEENRRYLGVEIQKKYYDIATERLNNFNKQVV